MNIRTSAFRSLAILSLSTLTFAACEDKTVTPPAPRPAAEVSITPQSVTLTVGQQTTVVGVVLNDTTGALSGVTYSSSNGAVATVDANGVVTAVSPGQATIIATSRYDNTKRAAASVTVNPGAVVSVTLIPSAAPLNVGATLNLVSVVTGSTNTAVTYSSSDTNVATVNATTGVVTGVAPGTAVITARSVADNTRTATSVITVSPTGGALAVSVSPTAFSIAPGATQQLTPTMTGGTPAQIAQGFGYTSSNSAVATVNGSGLVTAVTTGIATITVRSLADPTKVAISTVTVQSVQQPSISIAFVNNAAGVAVTPGQVVAGQLNVRVNVAAGSQTNISAVQVRVDGVVACTQTFAPPLSPTQDVATIDCPINTALTDANGVPVYLNGSHSISAVSLDQTGTVAATATFGSITFANANIATPVISTVGVSSPTGGSIAGPGSVAPGLFWNEGNVVVTIRPTMYAGGTVASTTVCLNPTGSAVPTANSVAVPTNAICRTAVAGANNTFTATFPKASSVAANGVAGIEAQGLTAGVTTITTAGANGPAGTSNAIALDNAAPVVTAFNVAPNTYINDAFTFAGSTGYAANDLGSNAPTATYNVQTTTGAAVAGGSNVQNSSGVAETATSTEYTLQVVVVDLNGNSVTRWADAAGAPSTTVAAASQIGVDRTAPTLTVTGPANGSTNSTNTYNFTFVDAGVGPSGFGATPLRIRVEQFTPNGTGGVTRICIDPITGLQLAGTAGTCGGATLGFVTSADAAPDVILPTATVDAYWQVTGRVIDFAGNSSTDVVRVTMNDDQQAPQIGFIVGPTIINGGTGVTFSAQMQDNVELGDQLGYVGYNEPGFNVYLVTQREALASYGFDVLTTPLTATHTIAQFIRSIESVNGANAPSTLISRATDMNLAVRDMAGFQLNSACPAAGAGGSTQNCTDQGTNILPAISLGMNSAAETSWSAAGRPFGTGVNNGGTAFTNTTSAAPVCSNIPTAAAGCPVNPSTKTLSATATGPAQTFANPFQRVNFYYTDAQGRSILIGTGTVTVTDNTVTATRTWAYTTSWNPNAMSVVAGAYPVFAVGVDSQGRALMSASVTVPVTSD